VKVIREDLCAALAEQMRAFQSVYSQLATQDLDDAEARGRLAQLLRIVGGEFVAVADRVGNIAEPWLTDAGGVLPVTPRRPGDRPTFTPPPVRSVLANSRPSASDPCPQTSVEPLVEVRRPTVHRGRQVVIGGRPAGMACSPEDVFDVMRQAGVEHDEIHWRGGGPGVWPTQGESH